MRLTRARRRLRAALEADTGFLITEEKQAWTTA
jgi:hypothetical protein